uniref:B box-type domain-containing protein n=2 Tax=Magallana gigas TaxID=29159 RepID=A0A8W8LVK6_MAGGI|nr:uncharacterized protein LOC105329443 isoform X3 [Crassostrea gigas]XP_034306463.1 uncharacterized protein LOC105329443 isoform X3 [Crassostrea gigas]XP_034306464.1 uncharacterized protein LOC105329443 isoform X3 [Crassostrea gigas]
MDPRHSAQDVVRCDLCKENIVQSYCDICHVSLCNPCIGDHISDGYHKHVIVPFQERKSTLKFPLCEIHSKETCKLQCKSCDVFLCVICSASHEHKDSDYIVLEDICKTKKEGIVMDTEEIEKLIAPTYEEIRKDLIDQIAMLDGEYEKITTVISEQGEKWHTEVNRVINKMKNEITEIKEKHRAILEKHLNEIKQIESLILGNLSALRELEESNDVSVILDYRPRIKEFRKLPAKVHVILPSFSPKPISGEQFYEIVGSLKPYISTTDGNGYKIKSPEVPHRELLDIPEIFNTFNTGYTSLRSISFYIEEEIWTSAISGDIKCFSTVGKCMKTITTKSNKIPSDIAVTRDGDLLYCDSNVKTLNKIRDGKTEEIIKLQGWTPINLCVTSTGDFLLSMYNDDSTQSQVVRYSGSTEKQSIQFDNEGNPLYSGNYYIKYIKENRNYDICVADWEAGAVVVVNHDGKLRWRYTGLPSGAKKNPFKPRGIITNSQSQILTADYDNNCIHILDQDGQFLRYIENVKNPDGLCVDNHDNLYVAEYLTGDVKVIRYLT